MRHRLWHSLHKFWDEEESLSIFLFVLLAFVFVIGPSSYLVPRFRLLIDVSFGIVLISGIWTTFRSRNMARLAALLVLLAVSSSIIELFVEEARWFRIFSRLCDIPALVFLLYVVLTQTLKEGPITSHRVKGAVASYVLLAVLWAKLYHLCSLVRANAFSGLDDGDPFPSLLYFSFVTLTTAGYGDILPKDVFARSLANAESLVGQLFPAIFIARLVSLQIDSRRPRKS